MAVGVAVGMAVAEAVALLAKAEPVEGGAQHVGCSGVRVG
jgi:hypothetical protein